MGNDTKGKKFGVIRKILSFAILYILLIFSAFEAKATQVEVSAPADEERLDPELNKFLFLLQDEVIDYLTISRNNLIYVGRCLVDQSQCADVVLTDADTKQIVKPNKSQFDYFAQVRKDYADYHLLVGQRNANSILNGQLAQRSKIKTGRPVLFNTRTREGRDEYYKIVEEWREYQKGIRRYTTGFSDEATNYAKSLLARSRDYYLDQQIAVYLERYPFFLKLGQLNPNDQAIVSAVQSLVNDYDASLGFAKELLGKRRLELMGFPHLFKKVLDKVGKDKADYVVAQINSFKNDKTFLARIQEIFTSWQTLTLMGCYVSSALPGLNWVVPFCAAFGLSIGLPRLIETYQRLDRYRKYIATGAFSEEAYQKQFAIFMASSFMSVYFLRSSVTGFVTGVSTLKTTVSNSVAEIRHLATSTSMNYRQAAMEVLKDEIDLAIGYLRYYSLDFSTYELASAGMRIRATLAALLAKSVQRTTEKAIPRISYNEIMKTSPLLAQ